MEIHGAIFEVERRFLRKNDPVRPYVRFGTGVGELMVDFQVVGASDRIKRTIPLVSTELGLRFLLTKHMNMTMAGYWNTGYGALAGSGWRF